MCKRNFWSKAKAMKQNKYEKIIIAGDLKINFNNNNNYLWKEHTSSLGKKKHPEWSILGFKGKENIIEHPTCERKPDSVKALKTMFYIDNGVTYLLRKEDMNHGL